MEIYTFLFWGSLIISTGLAVWGVLQKRSSMLVASSIISLPFSLILFGYPASRFFVIFPVIHLLAFLSVHRQSRGTSQLLLALIIGFVTWFLIKHFSQ